MTRGKLHVGTSGFAYPGWAPHFYPTGLRAGDLLSHYSGRLPAVELNNTFYQQPRPDKVAAWLAATPEHFRFVVKAQRGGSIRAFGDAAGTMDWLTGPYRLFGDRLGGVLYRLPDSVHRNDARLRQLLGAWPVDMPLMVEMQNADWQVDEVFDLLSRHSATLCATDLDDRDAPDLRLTGRSIYLRLRRTTYSEADLADWAGRLSAFLDSGTDCFCFFRHDADGTSALNAERLQRLLA